MGCDIQIATFGLEEVWEECGEEDGVGRERGR